MQLFSLVALALDLMGGRLFQKELVEKGSISGHFLKNVQKSKIWVESPPNMDLIS